MPLPNLDHALFAAKRAVDLAVRHVLYHQPTQITYQGRPRPGNQHRPRRRSPDPRRAARLGSRIGFLGEENGAFGDENTRWALDPIDVDDRSTRRRRPFRTSPSRNGLARLWRSCGVPSRWRLDLLFFPCWRFAVSHRCPPGSEWQPYLLPPDFSPAQVLLAKEKRLSEDPEATLIVPPRDPYYIRPVDWATLRARGKPWPFRTVSAPASPLPRQCRTN
jgi:hypothetical protein